MLRTRALVGRWRLGSWRALGRDPGVFRPDAALRDEARRTFDIGPGEVALAAAAALRRIKRIHDFVDLVAALAGRHTSVIGLVACGAVPDDEAYRNSVAEAMACGVPVAR